MIIEKLVVVRTHRVQHFLEFQEGWKHYQDPYHTKLLFEPFKKEHVVATSLAKPHPSCLLLILLITLARVSGGEGTLLLSIKLYSSLKTFNQGGRSYNNFCE